MARTLIFAHRGANREAAENTRSAFDKALEYPIDGIETDVQLSRDEVAVLWHDRFLGKLGLPLKHIDDFDHARLQKMNFAAHFSAQAKPEGIMGLQEFLDAYLKRCRLLLEIKNRDWEPFSRQELKVGKTLEMAGEDRDGSILVSSFNLSSLVYAHQCAKDFPLVYNFETDQTIDDARRVLMDIPFSMGSACRSSRWTARWPSCCATWQTDRGLHLQQRCGNQQGAGIGCGYSDQRCSAESTAIESREQRGQCMRFG